MPFKSSWTICKINKSQYPLNLSHAMQNKQFSVINDTCYQTIWIEDQAQRLVGPDFDPYCLKRSFKIKIFLEKIGKV